MARGHCPQCTHRAALVFGRCTEPAGRSICGCSCVPEPRTTARRQTPMSPEALRVLRAVEQGNTWGVAIIAATGLSMTAVYAILKRHRGAELLERDAGRGCHPDRYRLTERARTLLAEPADA